MPSMETMENPLIRMMATVAELKNKKKELVGALLSVDELNANGLPGTSNTVEFEIQDLSQSNRVIMSYSDESVWSGSLPSEDNSKSSSSADLQSVNSDPDLLNVADQRDDTLPVVKSRTFSIKSSKPDAFQLEAEAYNDKIKASIPDPPATSGERIFFRFRFQESLHKVSRSKDAVVYQCHICKGPYKQKFSLKRHFLRNHVNPEYISAADLSNCKIPIHNEAVIQQFVEESKTPSGRKRFKTNGATFVPDGVRRVPGLYKCHQCTGLRFDWEHELEEHYSTHLNENTDYIFPCTLCPSVFQKKQALAKHMVSHTEKKVIFRCKKCPLEFEQITDYTWHLQSHGSGKRCKYCDKEFSTPANRKRHENIHERGRVFSCRLCKAKYSRSKDLENHIKKLHNNLKLTCPHCPSQGTPVTFTSQYFLDSHITLKHRDIPIKKVVTNDKPTTVYRSHCPKSPKEYFCCFCKKKFSTIKAMVSHKNLVHKKEIARPKPKKSGQKEKVLEGSGPKFKTLPNNGKGPGEKNVSKAADHTQKTGILGKKRTTYERKAKSTPQYKLAYNKSYRKKNEAEKKFYSNVSSNVAENLIHHVDGGIDQINVRLSNFEDQTESFDYRCNAGEISWSAYNDSNYVDFGKVESKRDGMSQSFPQELCLYATGLERNETSVDNTLNLSTRNSGDIEEVSQSDSQDSPLNMEEKEKVIHCEIFTTFVCDVCKGTFPSYSEFEDHSVNNHPNVEVSFVEIEGTNENPPKVPRELRRLPYTRPNGILVNCELPIPAQEQFDIKCTKCDTRFNNKDELYGHMFECVTETSDIRFRRKLNQKNKKVVAMKNQNTEPMNKSGMFIRNKQIFKSRFRRNKFQMGTYYSGFESDDRDRSSSPSPSKLRPTKCDTCESVFVSKIKLPEHSGVCINRHKGAEDIKVKKKRKTKKRNDQPPEISLSISVNDAVKHSVSKDFPTSSSGNQMPSTELQVVSSAAELTLSSAKYKLTTPLKSVLEVPAAKVSDLNREKSVAVEKNILENVDLLIYRKLVTETQPKLPQVEDPNRSSVKRRELIPVPVDKSKVVLNSSDTCLAEHSNKNASEKSVKSTNSETLVNSRTAGSKQSPPNSGSVNLQDKIKEVVKEIQLAASSLPNLKKSSAPLTFLSPEVNQNIGLSSQTNNSPVQIGLISQSGKESVAVNESTRSEKARQRKKRKPVKIMHKMTSESENGLKNASSSFVTEAAASCLTPFNLKNSGFKPIENSGEQTLSENADFETPKPTVLVPVSDKSGFRKSDEKYSNNALELSTVRSEIVQINIDQEISTAVFLPEDKPDGSGDRDSPSLEVLVSSVTQSIENFDKPSLLDDEKFTLQTPDLINPTTAKSTESNSSTNNGLNFKILIPTGESPSNSPVSEEDSFNYLATKISAHKSTDESSLPISSDTNNVKTSVISKMKSLLNVSENSTNVEKPEEFVSIAVEDSVSSTEMTLPGALIPHLKNGSPTSSTIVNSLLESEQILCPIEGGNELNIINGEQMKSNDEKLDNANEVIGCKKGKGGYEKQDNKKKDSCKKGEGANKGHKKVNTNQRDSRKRGNDTFDVDDSPNSKKLAQGSIGVPDKVDAVNVISKQKSKQLKNKVAVVPCVSNEALPKKKVSSKLSINKKSDSKKGASLEPPIDNHQPNSPLATSTQLLTNRNEDKVETSVSSLENTTKLRQLRMKAPVPEEPSVPSVNENAGLNNSSETDISNNQLPNGKKRSVDDSKDDSKSLDNCLSEGGDNDVMVKKEKTETDAVVNRNCPYCYLDFSYLSNFRRHLLKCPSKQENTANEAPQPSTSQFQHLPKKNEVEESMLNLLRHQSRQNELIKETQKIKDTEVNKAEDNKATINFQKFSCSKCHKIYLSHFSYMQHVIQAHKMSPQEAKPADPNAPSTSEAVKIPLQENEINDHHENETDVQKEIRISEPQGPSTSQGVKVMPLEVTSNKNNMQVFEISGANTNSPGSLSELRTDKKGSTTTAEGSGKETSEVGATIRRNTCKDIPIHEFQSDNKGTKSDSAQNPVRCLENLNSPGVSKSVEETKTSVSSQDGRNISRFENGPEMSLALPVYGKGRGRKRKNIPEDLVEKQRDLKAEEHLSKPDVSSVNESRNNSISNAVTVTNNPLPKEQEKTLHSDRKSSPKNTLVNKLRNTLSKSMLGGGNLKTTPPKSGKKSEALKSADVSGVKHLEKDSSSSKSPIRKNPSETALSPNHPPNTSRRGRKKSGVARISLKQNVKGFRQESNDNLSETDVPSEAIDSSGKLITELHSRIHDTSKANKLKSSRNQSIPGSGSPTILDEKRTSLKRSLSNTSLSSKPAKHAKTSPQVGAPEPQSSQKSSAVTGKGRPRAIKANCDNEPTPSTSHAPGRGRNSRVTNVSLDLSSEPEDDENKEKNPQQRKKHNNKICAICKQKFPTLLERKSHVHLVHGREKGRNQGSTSPTFVPVKKETVNKTNDTPVNNVADSLAIVPDRSAYQRQCSKPLPPMRRKYQKVGDKDVLPVKKKKN